MGPRGRALPQGPGLLVDLESPPLELLDDALGEFAPGIVRDMFPKKPAEQVTAARQGKADREHELSAERVMIHWDCSCSVLRPV